MPFEENQRKTLASTNFPPQNLLQDDYSPLLELPESKVTQFWQILCDHGSVAYYFKGSLFLLRK